MQDVSLRFDRYSILGGFVTYLISQNCFVISVVLVQSKSLHGKCKKGEEKVGIIHAKDAREEGARDYFLSILTHLPRV